MPPEDTTDAPYCACGCGQKTNKIPSNQTKYGYIAGEYYRFLVGHSRRRYWLDAYEVDEQTGCWNWQGTVDQDGYGLYWRPNRRNVSAHRAMYERVRGPIPDGYQIDHLCRNHRCVNPWHCEPVKCAVNVRRGLSAKLTPVDVDQIRQLAPVMSQRALASRFGVCQSTISRLIRGKRWHT